MNANNKLKNISDTVAKVSHYNEEKQSLNKQNLLEKIAL